MNKVFYVSSFCKFKGKYNLRSSPAADAKSSYVLGVLKKYARVTLISVTSTKTKSRRFIPLLRENTDEDVENIITPSIGSKIRLVRGLNLFLPWFGMLYTFLEQIKKQDLVIVYHSCMYDSLLYYLKRIMQFKLILEVEEIYADVTGNEKSRKREMRLFRVADGYIVPTQLLNDVVNAHAKPAIISHGTYQVEPDRNIRFNDGKIHVLYAGTLDPRKGGAAAAAAAAAYLPDNYHVHILGFGTDAEKQYLFQTIAQSTTPGRAEVTYDGLLSGEAYIRFVQSCDIGLSTQNPDAEFNATSFPSKILSYLANGLRVVSTRIEAVERSAVADLITYYDVQTPEEIAKAIMQVDMDAPYDSRKRIAELDQQFSVELKNMLEELNK